MTGFALLLFSLFFLGHAWVAVWMIQRNKNKRNSRPPLDLALPRLPGESLRIKADELLESIVEKLVVGTLTAVFVLGVVPALIRYFSPQSDLRLLLVGTLAAFVAVSVFCLKKVSALGDHRFKVRLGLAGERDVAGHLQALAARGYRLFHDVPMSNENSTENIDHLAVGKHGVVVVETKTRSIPTDHTKGRLEVSFDGTRLKWPRFDNDQKTVRQVRRCAKWVEQNIQETFQFQVPVYQFIAIPGWQVVPGRCESLRVLNPGGIALAFDTMTDDKPIALKEPQIKKIANHFETLCRHTQW